MSNALTKFDASCTTIAVATKKGTIERTLLGVIVSTSKAAKQAASKHLTEKWWANGQFAPLARECANVFGALFTDFVTHPAIAMDVTTGRINNPHMTNRAAWDSVIAGLNAKDQALNKKGLPAPFKGEKRMVLDSLNHAVLVFEMNQKLAEEAAAKEFDDKVAAVQFDAVDDTSASTPAIEAAVAGLDALASPLLEGTVLDAAIAAELAAMDAESATATAPVVEEAPF